MTWFLSPRKKAPRAPTLDVFDGPSFASSMDSRPPIGLETYAAAMQHQQRHSPSEAGISSRSSQQDDEEDGQMPALHTAAFKGDIERIVCELIVLGANVNETVSHVNGLGDDVTGVTPLYMAAQAGHRGICEYLIRRGADLMHPTCIERTGKQFTPIDVALSQGHYRTWWMLRRELRKRQRRQAQQRQLVAAV